MDYHGPLPMLDQRTDNVAVHRQLWLSGICIAVLGFSLAAPILSAPEPKSPPSQEARVDINQASLEDLLKVPGMTRVWANRIVRFRPYRTKIDLLDRGVLSREVYDRVKDHLVAHRDRK